MRGLLAIAMAVGSLVALGMERWIGSYGSGGENYDVNYRMDGPAWTSRALYAAAVLALVAAAVLWAARHPVGLLVGLAAAAVAVWLAVSAQEARSRGPITRAAFREVHRGDIREAVRRSDHGIVCFDGARVAFKELEPL